jgi:hypothetical protein
MVVSSWTIAETIDEIQGLICSIDPSSGLATGLLSAAEVAGSNIAYGTLDRDQANARLRELGIVFADVGRLRRGRSGLDRTAASPCCWAI